MFIRKIFLVIILGFSLLSAYIFVPTIPKIEADYFELMQRMSKPKYYRAIYKFEIMFYYIRLGLFFDKNEYNTVFYSTLPNDGVIDNFFNIYELGYYHLGPKEYFKYVHEYGNDFSLTPLMRKYIRNNDIYSDNNKIIFCTHYNEYKSIIEDNNKEEYQIILKKMGGCNE